MGFDLDFSKRDGAESKHRRKASARHRQPGAGSVLALLLVLAACGPTPESALDQSRPSPSLTVLAAASTTDVMTELTDLFAAATGATIRLSVGPSNGLARQILSGAPADIFISANPRWIEALQNEGLVVDARPILRNGLVLVTPADRATVISDVNDLTRQEVSRVALAGEQVPAGRYAEQALRRLGLYEQLEQSRRVVRGSDVRVTLAYVERGETDAGIVYATDALISKRVVVVRRLDPGLHDPIVYPAAFLTRAAGNARARELYDHLSSPEARTVLSRHGFLSALTVGSLPARSQG